MRRRGRGGVGGCVVRLRARQERERAGQGGQGGGAGGGERRTTAETQGDRRREKKPPASLATAFAALPLSLPRPGASHSKHSRHPFTNIEQNHNRRTLRPAAVVPRSPAWQEGAGQPPGQARGPRTAARTPGDGYGHAMTADVISLRGCGRLGCSTGFGAWSRQRHMANAGGEERDGDWRAGMGVGAPASGSLAPERSTRGPCPRTSGDRPPRPFALRSRGMAARAATAAPPPPPDPQPQKRSRRLLRRSASRGPPGSAGLPGSLARRRQAAGGSPPQ